MKYLAVVLCVFIFLPACTQKEKQYVVMISFDGFRYDYVEKYPTPNFDTFIKNGVAAASLIPSFPSKTFPNHYTLVTGLYPSNHGLVDNTFYDKSRDVTYSMNKKELVQDAYFYGGTPLWQYAQQNGMKTASLFWVGSEAPVAGEFPTYYKPYDGRVSNEKRIEQLKNWLKLPEDERPQFISLYFSMVDSKGHSYGPLSAETEEAVADADQLLGLIMQELKKIKLPVNVLITSDHGMTALKDEEKSFIPLTKYLTPQTDLFVLINNSTHAQLYFKDKTKIDSVYNSLKNTSEDFTVYKKGEMPANWHYNSSNERIGDLLISAQIGKVFSTQNWEPRNSPYFGVHGYDPQEKDMHGIFYAKGPAINSGVNIPSFENIHVYPLVCLLLDLPVPDAIDGKAEVLEGIMQATPSMN